MSPARTSDHGIDISRLVRQILLDVTLLKWFAVNGGRGLAVINALVQARRESTEGDGPVLDFLERHVTPTQ